MRFGAKLVVVLEEQAGIEHRYTGIRVSNGHVVLRPAFMSRRSWSRDGAIDVVAVESGVGGIGVAREAQPAAELDGVRPLRFGGVVFQFEAILVVANYASVAASAGECALPR